MHVDIHVSIHRISQIKLLNQNSIETEYLPKCPSDMPQNHSQGKRKLKLSRRHKKNEKNDGCADPHSLVSDTKPGGNSDSKIVKKRGESPSKTEDRDPPRQLTRRSKVRQKHQPCDQLSNKRPAVEVNKSSVKPTMEDRRDAEKVRGLRGGNTRFRIAD